MKHILVLSIGTLGLLLQSASAGTIAYQQNFESSANGTGADGWYGYAGGSASTPSYSYVTNYLGSQVYQLTWDSTLDSGGYSYAGIGGGNYSAGTIPAGYSLSQITLSVDLAQIGSSSPNAFRIYLGQYVNNVQTWGEQFNPTTTTDGSFTTFSSTLDLGTGVSGTYNPSLTASVAYTPNSGFAFVAGNQIIIDNVVVTAVPEPGTMALAAMGGVALLFWHRRRSAC